jgi:hypothetical protein
MVRYSALLEHGRNDVSGVWDDWYTLGLTLLDALGTAANRQSLLHARKLSALICSAESRALPCVPRCWAAHRTLVRAYLRRRVADQARLCVMCRPVPVWFGLGQRSAVAHSRCNAMPRCCGRAMTHEWHTSRVRDHDALVRLLLAQSPHLVPTGSSFSLEFSQPAHVSSVLLPSSVPHSRCSRVRLAQPLGAACRRPTSDSCVQCSRVPQPPRPQPCRAGWPRPRTMGSRR